MHSLNHKAHTGNFGAVNTFVKKVYLNIKVPTTLIFVAFSNLKISN